MWHDIIISLLLKRYPLEKRKENVNDDKVVLEKETKTERNDERNVWRERD